MSRSQLGTLVALRWTMVRGRRARVGFVLLGATLPLLLLAAVALGLVAPRDSALEARVIAPTAFLSVALLAVLAPLVAGGGNELFPDEQLVAFPVTARTIYRASLALTPLNLAWTSQVVALLALMAYIVPRREWLVLSLALCLLYVGLVTVAGQAIAWLVVGIRARRSGQRWTWALAALLLVMAGVMLVAGRLTAVLDHAPTTGLVITLINTSDSPSADSVGTGAVLAALTAIFVVAGTWTCSWALRRPGDAVGQIESRPVTRREQQRDERRQRLATDRASVWRSASLRRGLLVLGVLPGIVAAAAGLEWTSLVLLPGLVAAGAGLLFGVNTFCLDGSGSVWLASLPGSTQAWFWSKAQVVAETCFGAIALTLAAGSVRAGRLPTASELAAVGSCAVVALARVAATCMELSVDRPHRADLRGARDTPAPPGVMAAYSARLAVSTTLVAVLFSALAAVASWPWPVLVAVPFVLFALRRLVRAAARWQDAAVRSHVVTVVASG
jgi:hypothetical protein